MAEFSGMVNSSICEAEADGLGFEANSKYIVMIISRLACGT